MDNLQHCSQADTIMTILTQWCYWGMNSFSSNSIEFLKSNFQNQISLLRDKNRLICFNFSLQKFIWDQTRTMPAFLSMTFNTHLKNLHHQPHTIPTNSPPKQQKLNLFLIQGIEPATKLYLTFLFSAGSLRNQSVM